MHLLTQILINDLTLLIKNTARRHALTSPEKTIKTNGKFIPNKTRLQFLSFPLLPPSLPDKNHDSTLQNKNPQIKKP
jgi:hypothetical protein